MTKNDNVQDNDDMVPEYDLSDKQGVRGKYYRAYQQGHTVTIHHDNGTTTTTHYTPDTTAIVLAPDVQIYFPDSEAVNHALRSLITLIPKRQKTVRRTSNKRRRGL
jgi:hypothetical protein